MKTPASAGVFVCYPFFMNVRTIVGILVALAVLCTAIAAIYTAHIEEKRLDELRFSNTQAWDPALVPHLPGHQNPIERARTDEYLAHISLPPPPGNTSTTTRAELAELHALSEIERPSALLDIEAEVLAANLRFGDYVYGHNDKPETTRLLVIARDQLVPVIMTIKQEFDRVRPDQLDPTLTTAIVVPGHPAYPSGHATESYLIALILSELDPANADTYAADAIRIARNREIAGVHYPSDSETGRMLARQFFDLFMQSADAARLLPAARAEWQE